MRPTSPHLSSSSPDFRAYARMQASNASACLRKLSDLVNSVSKPHADARSFMVSYLFCTGFRLVILLLLWEILFLHGDFPWQPQASSRRLRSRPRSCRNVGSKE